MTRRPVAAAVVLVVALVAVAPVATGTAGIYDLDANHELATTDAISTYESEGVVTGGTAALNMSLTVADDAGDVGLSSWSHASFGRTYLRVSYQEDLERTIRFYVPRDYFRPRVKQGLEAVDSDATVSLEPAENRQYTAVTIHVTGPTDAVFPVSGARGIIADSRSGLSDVVSNATGVDVPGLDGGQQWDHVKTTAISGENATHELPTNSTDVTIQYDADESPTDTQWIPVQACGKSEQPVCSVTRPATNQTLLVSKTTEPPAVRWTTDASASGAITSTINDVQRAVERIAADVQGILGGD